MVRDHETRNEQVQHLHEWQRVPATTDKTLRFEQQIHIDRTENTRVWLRVSNVLEHVALWIDDHYLGENHTPYHLHAYRIPRILELPNDTNNALLGVEFLENSPADNMPTIDVFRTGPIRITRHKVLCTEANASLGSVELHVELDSLVATPVWIRTVITDAKNTIVVDDARRRSLAKGKNRLRWTESLDEPALWQPNNPALYHVCTQVGLHDDNQNNRSDAWQTVTGFRSITQTRKSLEINGIPLHSLSRLTQVESPSIYNQADQAGELIVQQLSSDIDGARQIIEVLAHHPSIVAWTKENKLAHRWTWSTDSLTRTVDRADGTRPLL